MILNSEIWANAMREKILGKLQLVTTVFCTSTENQFSMYQFREAAHIVGSQIVATPALHSRADIKYGRVLLGNVQSIFPKVNLM